MKLDHIPPEFLPHKNEAVSPQVAEAQGHIMSMFQTLLVNTTDEDEINRDILSINGKTIFTLGNISVSIGKPKSRKTFNVSAIVAALLSGKEILGYKGQLPKNKNVILYFDTEQSKGHCKRVKERIMRLAGLEKDPQNLMFVRIKGFKPEVRRWLIEWSIETFKDKGLGFVVIDGLRDLLDDINSSPASGSLKEDEKGWTEINEIHIHNVLHLNKTDDNARGHVGSEFNNVSETVLLVSKSKTDSNVSEVSPMFQREEEFTPFAFRIDDDGLPILAEGYSIAPKSTTHTKKEKDQITNDDHRKALEALFKNGMITGYQNLLAGLSAQYKELGHARSDTTIKDFIKRMFEAQVIVSPGRGKYLCNINNISNL